MQRFANQLAQNMATGHSGGRYRRLAGALFAGEMENQLSICEFAEHIVCIDV